MVLREVSGGRVEAEAGRRGKLKVAGGGGAP
jgi:hypothetical protein